MCYIVFIPRIQRPLRPASVFSMMMMMMMMYCTNEDKKSKQFMDDGNDNGIIMLVIWTTKHRKNAEEIKFIFCSATFC